MKHMNEIRKTVPVTQERTRVTLDLSNRLSAIVEDIAKDRGTTKADVVRMAIEFLAMANDASEEGMNVGAWKDDKENNRFMGISPLFTDSNYLYALSYRKPEKGKFTVTLTFI